MVKNTEQLSIFTIKDSKSSIDLLTESSDENIETKLLIEEDILPYEIGERVYIINRVSEEIDPEAFYYLKQWEKKRGEVAEIIPHPRLQYKVQIGKEVIYAYHEELSITLDA